jgi:acyl-CoA reductase-like NAD-dependent aldehyde dehydrogenase
VERSRYEDFVRDLVAVAESQIRVGPPEEPGVVMSALIDDRAVEKTRLFVEDAETRGARRLTGGHREGRVFDPMVMVDVPADARLACEEVFGPVVAIWPYDGLRSAFERVNASPYGLQAGIYTRDLGEANRAYEALEVGAVLVDEIPAWRVDQMPYGGVKASGFGREGLRDSLAEYTEPRLFVLPRG